MDLQDPTKKMSKSDEFGKGVIFLNDDPGAAAKKVMSATTDDKAFVAFDPLEQPGISNLLQIHALLANETLETVIERHAGQVSYGDFKKEIAEQVKVFLTDFQAKLTDVDEASVLAKLESSEVAMNEQANATLLRAQQAVGLRPKA
jgi:tryptophanyl-tRNA synthetase